MGPVSNVDTRSALVGAALVLLLILVVAALCLSCPRAYNSYLAGMWVGDPAFLAKARLSDMKLFISPPDAAGARQGYLIMTDANGEFLVNGALEVEGGFGRGAALRARLSRRAGGRAVGPLLLRAKGLEAVLPGALTAELSIGEGSLALRDSSKLWGAFSKDFAGSAEAVAVWRQRQAADGAAPAAAAAAVGDTAQDHS